MKKLTHDELMVLGTDGHLEIKCDETFDRSRMTWCSNAGSRQMLTRELLDHKAVQAIWICSARASGSSKKDRCLPVDRAQLDICNEERVVFSCESWVSGLSTGVVDSSGMRLHYRTTKSNRLCKNHSCIFNRISLSSLQ